MGFWKETVANAKKSLNEKMKDSQLKDVAKGYGNAFKAFNDSRPKVKLVVETKQS